MVLLPGCRCCGCSCPFPLTYATTSIEVEVESTGSDAYYSWASTTDCLCGSGSSAGEYNIGSGYASYAPPSGTYSLTLSGNFQSVSVGGIFYPDSALFTYEDNLVALRAGLNGCYPGRPDGLTFRVSGNTCRLASYFRYAGPAEFGCARLINYATAMRGSLDPAYDFAVSYSCADGIFQSAANRLPAITVGYPAPLVTNNPTPSDSYAEFRLWTWTPDPTDGKQSWAVNSQTLLPGCGPAVFTDGPSSGTVGAASQVTFRISRVTVKYSDGTPDLDLL